MKIRSQLCAMFGILMLSATAAADPVPYQFSGSITGGAGPFVLGTELNATFLYDTSIVPVATDVNGDDIGLATYGLVSIYLGGVSNFVADIAGVTFGSDGTAVLVGDGTGDPSSGIFADARGESPGWTGLSINGFELLSFVMFTVGTADMLADQSMPAEWPNFADIEGGVNTGLNMVFADSTGQIFVQNIWGNADGNVSITPVPEPATVALLAIGLFGTLLVRRRRLSISRPPASR
ncbi:MAG: PEP-CTERM sorting domain-containing protein [Woeseiaceae bacterium]|nr:PEP-CTERM sorting domain-containing protein [Woeseiaceae bacterium]